jgi:small subunit ribosomal protein S21
LTLCGQIAIKDEFILDEFGGVRFSWQSSIAGRRVARNALRRLRKVQQEDTIKEVERHSFYLKPGEKKRVKQALARKRSRKKQRNKQEQCCRAHRQVAALTSNYFKVSKLFSCRDF